MNEHTQSASIDVLDSLTTSIHQIFNEFNASVEISLTEENSTDTDFCGNFGLLLGNLYGDLKGCYETALFQYGGIPFGGNCRCLHVARIARNFVQFKLNDINKNFADVLMSDVVFSQEIFLDTFTDAVVSTKEIDANIGFPWYNINFSNFHRSWFENLIVDITEKVQTDFSKLDGVANRGN